MKNIIKLIVSLSLLLVIASCEKDEDRAIIDPNPPSLLTPAGGTTMVLVPEDRDLTIEFTWEPASFGFDASVNYTVEMARQGTDFATPLTIGVVNNKTSLVVVIEEFNNKLLNYLTDPETTEALVLDIRVKAIVSSSVDPVFSTFAAITVTPFLAPMVYPLLSVPGSHQGWNPADSSTVVASLKSDGKYEGYLWFPDDNTEFKYTSSFSWAENFGDDGADGTLNPDGANIIAGASGYYKLNVNMNELTHAFLRTEWGLIGSATPGGWDSDQNLAYNAATKVWTITLNLVQGEIKFRANDDWAINLGDDALNGKLGYGEANIPVDDAGNYTITLDLSKPVYTYSVVKN